MLEDERQQFIANISLALEVLTPSQLVLVRDIIAKLSTKTIGYRNPESNFISEASLAHIGDALLAHHSLSQAPLSKDRFEYALESALRKAGHEVVLATHGNPGHDMTVDGVQISLKTQADAGIKADLLHVSKFMELGKGEWRLDLLRDRFLHHMRSYERIFQLRCFRQGAAGYLYEFVEIPKKILLEGAHARLQIRDTSRQNPKPGYAMSTTREVG